MFLTVLINLRMFYEHVGRVVVVLVPARAGINDDMVVGFLRVGLDDLLFSEYVVKMGQGLGVSRLWAGVEVLVHVKIPLKDCKLL
jgi:hypothetical protein